MLGCQSGLYLLSSLSLCMCSGSMVYVKWIVFVHDFDHTNECNKFCATGWLDCLLTSVCALHSLRFLVARKRVIQIIKGYHSFPVPDNLMYCSLWKWIGSSSCFQMEKFLNLLTDSKYLIALCNLLLLSLKWAGFCWDCSWRSFKCHIWKCNGNDYINLCIKEWND